MKEGTGEPFVVFSRADESRTRETGGAGLGLAITECAVRLRGGTAPARNIPGGGFNVETRVPRGGTIKSG